VPDTTSGFRAHTRAAALQISIVSDFSYTLEAIIQASQKKLAIASVPIRTNEKLREPRLYSSTFVFLRKSASTMIRTYAMYESLKVFFAIGGTLFLAGFMLGLRFLYFYINGEGAGHVQSVILASMCILLGFFLGMIRLLADLISANRKLIEDTSVRVRRLELSSDKEKQKA